MTKKLQASVFLSYSRRDNALAAESAALLRSRGYSVIQSKTSLTGGDNWTESLREDIATSDIVVFAIAGEPGQWIAFELGAALAWSKPVFVVYSGTRPQTEGFPQSKSIQWVPIEKLANALESSQGKSDALNNSEIDLLVELYRETAIPLDQLILQPARLASFAARFARSSGTTFSTDVVAQELIRLRKAGKLPRLRKSPSAKRK